MDKPDFDKVVDHPSFNVESTPKRLNLPVSGKVEGISTDEFIDVPEAQRKNLKVYDDLDNQMNLQDVDRTPMQCYVCGGEGEYIIATIEIPHFGKAEIFSFSCDECGWKTRKVKSGLSRHGESKTNNDDIGTIITLTVKGEEDLQRQIVRSDTAKMTIPSIEFESEAGDGVYTTVEGLIQGIVTTLAFTSIVSDDKQDVSTIVGNMCKELLANAREGNPFDIILDDPYSDSFVQPKKCAPSVLEDDQIKIETYSRFEREKETMRESKHMLVADMKTLVPGTQVQAMWEHEWIENCKLINFLNEDKTLFFVCQKGKEDEGGWQVNLDGIRTSEGIPYKNTVTHTGSMSTEELMEKLNIMADHVEMEESGKKREERRELQRKEEQQIEAEIEGLDDMD
mmetsp:Transcript_6618/g.8074  ORF Transcript_6618/g.8074 Transcript_6618/m.8074 type:complete len:396 (-) Transcript_6618:57-1244(-)